MMMDWTDEVIFVSAIGDSGAPKESTSPVGHLEIHLPAQSGRALSVARFYRSIRPGRVPVRGKNTVRLRMGVYLRMHPAPEIPRRCGRAHCTLDGSGGLAHPCIRRKSGCELSMRAPSC